MFKLIMGEEKVASNCKACIIKNLCVYYRSAPNGLPSIITGTPLGIDAMSNGVGASYSWGSWVCALRFRIQLPHLH